MHQTETETCASLHRHPSKDENWFEVRYDSDEYTIGIDRDWTGHVNKVVLDFSGYRREFDCSSMYERHTLHQPDSNPDIDVVEEALIDTKQGILATWQHGTEVKCQISEDLINWQDLSFGETRKILSTESIALPNSGPIGESINKYRLDNRVSHEESISRIAKRPLLFERCVEDSAPEWQLNHFSKGFKSVTRMGLVVFTITPLDIVHWIDMHTPELLTENEAIGELRGLVQVM